MTVLRFFPLLLLGLLLASPPPAEAQTQRDRAEQRIRERCGDDQACIDRMREQMRERRQQGAQQAQPAASPAGARAQMPRRMRRAFEQLSAETQRAIAAECDDDLDCYRDALRRHRQQGGRQAISSSGDGPGALPPPPAPGGRTALDPAPTPPLDVNRVDARSDAGERPMRTGGRLDSTQVLAPGARPDVGVAEVPGRRSRGGVGTLPTGPGGAGSGLGPIVSPGTGGPGSPPAPEPEPEAPYTHFHYGESDDTNISGAGGHTVITKQPGNGAFLVGLESEEQDDAPCGWRFLWYRDNDTDTVQGYFTTRGGDCDRTVQWNDDWGTRYHQNATIDYIESPSSDDVRAVKSIQVCLNRDDDRIKGVRVWGAHIDTAGRVSSDDNLYGAFERTNCHDWSTERTCPSGEVAVGVNLEFGDASSLLGRSDNNASGIRLVCADPYTDSNE
ncbi:MAG: hypothetical protein AAGK21_02265 [Bacteroidota bacterium]